MKFPVRTKGAEIEPLKKEGELPQADLHHLLLGLRPAELLLFEPLLEKTEPVPLPVEDLYGRPPSIAENKEMS